MIPVYEYLQILNQFSLSKIQFFNLFLHGIPLRFTLLTLTLPLQDFQVGSITLRFQCGDGRVHLRDNIRMFVL